MFDFSGSYRFNRMYELTVSGRNILNSPIRTYANEPGLLRVINHYGASWTVGVRGDAGKRLRTALSDDCSRRLI